MNEPPDPEAVPNCGLCAGFNEKLQAIPRHTSEWSDVRVLWRRHLAAKHDATMPVAHQG